MSASRDIAAAIRLLTIVPVGSLEGGEPARYFPLVGWLYGLVAVGIAQVSGLLHRSDGLEAVVVAALVVGTWALLSGLLHVDGLADSADGLGVRGDAQRRMEVMKDSSVGAFGVTAIVLVLVLEVAAVAAIVESQCLWALVAAPVIGRWGAAMALMYRTPARAGGLAMRYASHPSVAGVGMASAFVAPLLVFAWPPSASVALVTLLGVAFAVVAPGVFARRLGGITGDVLGATVVLSEAFVLCAGALIGGFV
ncbi:MAG: adenosylcobinamide-GDP ribazoletransferase [Coriobacteriia bacterium]|nr:adenosylcobinamide-GDP ribazoletransferase [Coriobacteriia bacterium]